MIGRIRAVLRRLPGLRGQPIEVRYRREGGGVHAGSFLRERRISLDPALRGNAGEFARILVHEIFHFVWLRIGNVRRREFESLLQTEIRTGVHGELGWSAARRKEALRPDDLRRRTRAWRLYACESFCDTAAWVYSGLREHEEFNLPPAARRLRRRWLVRAAASRRLAV